MKTSTIDELLQLVKETNNIHTQNIIDILEIEKQRVKNIKVLKKYKKIHTKHPPCNISDNIIYQRGYNAGLKQYVEFKESCKSNLPYLCNFADIACKMAMTCTEIANAKKEALKQHDIIILKKYCSDGITIKDLKEVISSCNDDYLVVLTSKDGIATRIDKVESIKATEMPSTDKINILSLSIKKD